MILDTHSNCSVLCYRLVGYAEVLSEVSCKQLFAALTQMVDRFSELAVKHDCELVDVNADGGIAVAGLNEAAEDHTSRIVQLAIEMIKTVKETNFSASRDGGLPRCIEARIGIHTGKAYAGVFGRKRPHFKFFGDAVLVAGELEATGYSTNIRVSCGPTSPCSLHCFKAQGTNKVCFVGGD